MYTHPFNLSLACDHEHLKTEAFLGLYTQIYKAHIQPPTICEAVGDRAASMDCLLEVPDRKI